MRLGMLDRFDSAGRATQIGGGGVPTLCIHGTLDEIAPIGLGRALFDALPSPRKQWVALEGTGHNDVPYKDPRKYLETIAAYLAAEPKAGQGE